MMKFAILTVLGLMVTVTWAQQLSPQLMQAGQQCASQYGTTVQELRNLRDRPSNQVPRNTKCFMSCVAMRLGVMSPNGAVNRNLIEGRVGRSVANRFFGCYRASNDPCETAYSMALCRRQLGINV